MKHPLRSTGEAGIEPALTVLETAFLPLEDSPIYEYKESVARFLSGAVRTLKTAYTCCRLDGGLATAFLLSLRKRVTQRSLRSRFRAFAFKTFFQTEAGHSSLATLTIS